MSVPAFAVAAVVAIGLGAGQARAGADQPAADSGDQYQIYIGGRGGPSYDLNREWGSLRLSEGGVADGNLGAPLLSRPETGAGITYFTPSLSGVRVGVGMAASGIRGGPETAGQAPYTDLGPRRAPQKDGAGNWKMGGSVEYSGLEVGAAIGDHSDPSCGAGGNCATNDFWDIGVALRIGSGAISAGYTASQPRSQRSDDVNRIDIYSLNAGYMVAPGMNIYGGVDWIDLQSANENTDLPLDTRFMLGTNLRF